MELISLGNHIVRKALILSLNEMAVLCDILKMSQNPKYGNWCVKSKRKMAEWLDLSEDTIFKILKTLEQKNYIERSDIGVKPSQFIYNLNLCQEEIGVAIKTNDITFITLKIKELYPSDTLSEKSVPLSEIPIPNLSEIPILDKTIIREEKKDIKKQSFDFSLIAPEYVDLVKEYISYRKQIKKPYKTQGAVNALGKKLVSLSNDNLEVAKKIVQQSYDKEWQDVFPLKDNVQTIQSPKTWSQQDKLKADNFYL